MVGNEAPREAATTKIFHCRLIPPRPDFASPVRAYDTTTASRMFLFSLGIKLQLATSLAWAGGKPKG